MPEKVRSPLQRPTENLHNRFRKEVKLEMRPQRKPEPEEKIHTIPANCPAAYEQELSHSSGRIFFHYSDIEAAPVNYGTPRDFAGTEYEFPVLSGISFEASLTGKDPYAYPGSIRKHSGSAGIQDTERKKRPALKKPGHWIMRLQTQLKKGNAS